MIAGVLLALSLGGAGVPAQAAVPPTAPVPVTLSVVVTDGRGHPVPTLTAGDFTVTESGRHAAVDAVRFAGSAQPSSTEPASRVFAVLLDDFHVSAGDGADRARAALTSFVNELTPGDRLVVLRPLDSLLTIKLTSDRQAALDAIAQFTPRRDDFTPRTDFERTFIAEAPERVAATRARVVTSALRALVTELAQQPETRRTLVLVSGGFVDPGTRRGEDVAPPLRSVISAANRANVAIYTVDPETTPAAPDDQAASARAEALHSLAAETGGLSFDASADPRTALQAAVADASSFYAVTFTPSSDDTVALEAVDIAVARRGLTVRAQKAFGRPVRERAAAPPATPSFLSPFSTQMMRRTSALIRPWFGMSRADDGKTRVSFVWEPTGRVPGDRSVVGVPSKIALTVTTLDGTPVFTGEVAAAPTNGVSGGAEPTRASFDTPAGRLLVQMAIEDLSARVIDRDVRDLVVGGFPGPIALGTAEVFRTRTARERQQIATNIDATPVASRTFSRSERLLMRVPVFTDAAPEVTARLISPFGNVLRELQATPIAGAERLFQVDLPLAAFAPGTYNVDIQARTPTGSASERIAFRITP